MTTLAVAPRRLPRWRMICLMIGIAAGIALVAGFFTQTEHVIFFRAYLFAWLFFLGLALGGTCLIMLHNLTGGAWGDGARVIGWAAGLTVPLLAVLFIPVLLGLPELYIWARPAEVAANETLKHRSAYLNVPFFVVRAVIYFAVWTALAYILATWQRNYARTGNRRVLSRIRGLSAAGLIIYLMTMTHAALDWMVSRDVSFYTTTFGFIVTTGQTLAAMAFALIVLSWVPVRQAAGEQASVRTWGVLNDAGNILLVLVILWTYVTFMQLLVIWMGNTQEDNAWFVQRGLSQPGPWRWVGLGLVLFHFFVPFYLLLFRDIKGRGRLLAGVAWMLLLAHVVQVYWLVAPSGQAVWRGEGPLFNPSWLDLAAFVAVGGVWLAGFLWVLERRR